MNQRAYRHRRETRLWSLTANRGRQQRSVLGYRGFGRGDQALARGGGEAENRANHFWPSGHEIHTPMNGVIGRPACCWRPRSSIGTASGGRHHRSSGDNLLRVLSDILDLSKRWGRTIPVRGHRFSPAVLVEAVAAVVGRCRQQGLAVQVELDPALPAVGGDVAKFARCCSIASTR